MTQTDVLSLEVRQRQTHYLWCYHSFGNLSGFAAAQGFPTSSVPELVLINLK